MTSEPAEEFDRKVLGVLVSYRLQEEGRPDLDGDPAMTLYRVWHQSAARTDEVNARLRVGDDAPGTDRVRAALKRLEDLGLVEHEDFEGRGSRGVVRNVVWRLRPPPEFDWRVAMRNRNEADADLPILRCASCGGLWRYLLEAEVHSPGCPDVPRELETPEEEEQFREWLRYEQEAAEQAREKRRQRRRR